MKSDDSILQIDRADPSIATITFNRPTRRNALSVAMMEAIGGAVRTISSDRACRVIIFRGAGSVFCAGLDLHEAAASDAGRSAEALLHMYESICACPLVTIAAAQGAAMGGGAGLLSACDFVVASEDLLIAYPEVKRGLVGALVTCLVRRQLSDRAARELILSGRTVSAVEAKQLGLVSEVVGLVDLQSAPLALARHACLGAPGAVARTKRLLDEAGARPIAESLRHALGYHLAARNSGEAAEGIAAFLEKREPRWGLRED